MNVFQFTNSTW